MTSQPRPDGRFVWMTHADVSWLHTSTDTPQRRDALTRLNIGFNSAPADAAEAVRDALAPLSSLDRIDDRGKTDLATSSTRAALLALGYPHTEHA